MLKSNKREITISVSLLIILFCAYISYIFACFYTDKDKDGVVDYKDKCPSTFKSLKVDDNGCVPDSDNDGISDFEDMCPQNTLEEISKSVYQSGSVKGCPLDTDWDGVSDYKDLCPATSYGISIDYDGCPMSASTTSIHIVQVGDTLYSIATQYECSVGEIALWNNLSPPYSLEVGQRLQVSQP